MSFNCSVIESKLAQEHKDALTAGGTNVAAIVQWFEALASHLGSAVCAIAPLLTVMVQSSPWPQTTKDAIMAVLTLMCPPVPAPVP